MYKAVKEVKKRFPEGPPLLNPVDDMKIQNPEFIGIVKKIEILEKKYVIYSCIYVKGFCEILFF